MIGSPVKGDDLAEILRNKSAGLPRRTADRRSSQSDAVRFPVVSHVGKKICLSPVAHSTSLADKPETAGVIANKKTSENWLFL
jgi:hypothetical protein